MRHTQVREPLSVLRRYSHRAFPIEYVAEPLAPQRLPRLLSHCTVCSQKDVNAVTWGIPSTVCFPNCCFEHNDLRGSGPSIRREEAVAALVLLRAPSDFPAYIAKQFGGAPLKQGFIVRQRRR